MSNVSVFTFEKTMDSDLINYKDLVELNVEKHRG
jgi:hypothetical protein